MISIGILTHNSPLTLKNTLMSYKHYGLLEYSDDIFCVIQPSPLRDEEIKICSDFNIKYYSEGSNTFMQGGISRIITESKYDIVLFTENDFRIQTTRNYKEILDSSIKWISNGVVDLIRIRDLKNPGHPIPLPVPLYDDITNNKTNRLGEYMNNIHYFAHYVDDPDIFLPSYFTKYSENPRLLVMSSKYCGYTNNCFITTKKFFDDNLRQYANMDNPNFESGVDKIWHLNDYKIGITDGFLTHIRVDGHQDCACCHSSNGGRNNDGCQCCEGDFVDNLEFIIDENGNDISNYSSGVDKIMNLRKDKRDV